MTPKKALDILEDDSLTNTQKVFSLGGFPPSPPRYTRDEVIEEVKNKELFCIERHGETIRLYFQDKSFFDRIVLEVSMSPDKSKIIVKRWGAVIWVMS